LTNLSPNKADINSANIENRTALHCAIFEKRVEAVKLLLKYGALVDVCTVHYRTPLHFVSIIGDETICQILLNAGADVNKQDFQGNTPVHYAAFYSKFGVVFRIHRDIKAFIREESRFINKE